jgi:methionyl-tRNA synthetase
LGKLLQTKNGGIKMNETTLTIVCKKSDNKAFKGSDDSWYNLNDNVVPYLEKMNKGDKIVIEYTKKGVSRYVSKLTSADIAETPKTTEPEPTKSSTGFACEVCGKELKDGRFKKCFVCNKKNPTPRTEKKSYYDSPEKTAQIQRGNALNAAGFVASNQQFADPEEAIQYTLEVAERLLEWLRIE